MAFPTSTRYLIIGAGVHGLSTAYHAYLLQTAKCFADSAARGTKMFREVTLRRQPFIESVGATQDRPSKLRGNSGGSANSD